MAFGAWAVAFDQGGMTSAFLMCGVRPIVKSGARGADGICESS
jgi:hypothetical protein